MNAQLIDDVNGTTLLGVSTLGQNAKQNHSNKESAKQLASEFVKKLSEKNVKSEETFVFDRGDKKYHGKVAAFVDELRAQGVKI
jgi:large subunit ribosomal protein L18